MRRINVVGTSCSGKATMARELAARLALPHVEFDALFWGPEWTPVPGEMFRQRLTDALPARRGSPTAATRRCATSPGNASTRSSGWTIGWRSCSPAGRGARSVASGPRRSSGPGPATASRSITRSGATACCGGSSARTAAGDAGWKRASRHGRTSCWSASEHRARRRPGWRRSRPRAASTRCRRRSARASRSAIGA
jgi:hypothetical protein